MHVLSFLFLIVISGLFAVTSLSVCTTLLLLLLLLLLLPLQLLLLLLLPNCDLFMPLLDGDRKVGACH